MERKASKIYTWLSPTLLITSWSKNRHQNAQERGKAIINTLRNYLRISILIAVSIGLTPISDYKNEKWFYIIISCICLFSWSRVYESLYALIKDSCSYIVGSQFVHRSTNLTILDRIKLVFKNYIECVIHFGIIFYILQFYFCNFLNHNGKPQNLTIIDTLYFSASTITTLGYGDISPGHWLSKCIVMLELYCGLLLLVLTLTVYIGMISTSTKINKYMDKQ